MLWVQVLLNLLIALMGSIYEEEQENSANHRRAERASMILEIVREFGLPVPLPCPSHHPYPVNRSLRCPMTSVATRTFSRSICMSFAKSLMVNLAQQHLPAVLRSLMLLCAPRQAHGGGAKTWTFRRAASWKVAQQGW